MNVSPPGSAAASADPSSPAPTGGAPSPATPAPGDSAQSPRKLRRRDRAWIILVLLGAALLLIEWFDRVIGIPNR